MINRKKDQEGEPQSPSKTFSAILEEILKRENKSEERKKKKLQNTQYGSSIDKSCIILFQSSPVIILNKTRIPVVNSFNFSYLLIFGKKMIFFKKKK